MGERTAGWVGAAVRWRWPVLGLFATAVAVALAYAGGHLRMNTDTADLLSPDLPFLQEYRRHQAGFPQYTDSLVAVVEAGTPEGAHRGALELARRLRSHPALFHEVYLPGLDPFFNRHALLFMDLASLQRTAERLIQMQPFFGRVLQDPSLRGVAEMLRAGLEAVQNGRTVDLAPALAVLDRAIRARLTGQGGPVSWERLLFAGGGDEPARRFVLFQPRLDFTSLYPAHQALEVAHRLRQGLPSAPGESLQVRLTGEPAMADEEMRSVTRGMAWAAGLSLGLVLVVLYLGLRSVRLTAAVLVTLLAGLALTAGFAALAVGTLNVISVVFAVLYIGLGVDFGIHWTLGLRERLLNGQAVVPALHRVGRRLGPALGLCALTTAAGFFAFMPTDYRGVSELGLIAGSGMIIALGCTLTLLPALLGTRGIAGAARGSAAGLPERLAAWPLRHAVPVRWTSLLLVGAALLFLPRLHFDPDPLHLRDPQGEAVATYRALMHSGERRPPEAVALAGSADQAGAIARRLQALPSVGETVWLGSFVPEGQDEKLALIDELALVLGPELERPVVLHPAPPEAAREALRSLHGQLQAMRDDARLPPRLRARITALHESLGAYLAAASPASPDWTRRIQALERDLLEYLPDNLERLAEALDAGPVRLDRLPADLVRRWHSEDGLWRVAAYPAAPLDTAERLYAFVRELRDLVPNITGAPVLHVEAARVVVGAFVEAFALAGLAIVLLLALALRSATDVLAVLAPLAAASLGTGALMVLSGIPFNFANIIALPLLLGIGVDNGIHMVSRMRAGDANPLAHATGRAVLVSALTTLASFGSLAFSAHPGTASLGRVLSLGLGLTLVATLVMLPALSGTALIARAVKQGEQKRQ